MISWRVYEKSASRPKLKDQDTSENSSNKRATNNPDTEEVGNAVENTTTTECDNILIIYTQLKTIKHIYVLPSHF